MVRPNIDIPNRVHGTVKDYADREDLDLSEAYEKILKKGSKLVGFINGKDIDYECKNCGSSVFFVDYFNPDVNEEKKCIICTNCGSVWPIDITGEEQTK